ncbi:hypothetical protein OF117_10740 [Geodermatophilus sp. YIM 151500]|uniref:hypothetical protein n=1 Tax=Geodermatophilus sp. YIM 151500 TaxID=2984531 RepID=UPI0021E3F7BC|nr:hypothetical protein [Geodermatophilus sp. YIM 151500]MCV2489839.1 hypothetical protein [Geodermatophilus sp. YIM 151500]
MIVLDVSAPLSLINRKLSREVGVRATAGDDATISAVNYPAVLQQTARVGLASRTAITRRMCHSVPSGMCTLAARRGASAQNTVRAFGPVNGREEGAARADRAAGCGSCAPRPATTTAS